MHEHMRPAGAFDFYIHAEDDNPPDQALNTLRICKLQWSYFCNKIDM